MYENLSMLIGYLGIFFFLFFFSILDVNLIILVIFKSRIFWFTMIGTGCPNKVGLGPVLEWVVRKIIIKTILISNFLEIDTIW